MQEQREKNELLLLQLQEEHDKLVDVRDKLNEKLGAMNAKIFEVEKKGEEIRKANDNITKSIENGETKQSILPQANASELDEPIAIAKEETQENANKAEILKNCRNFVVTAYYSPLAGQRAYNMGTLSAEKRLQGNGTNGASGKEVFDGMMAAPKKYAFGTKIEISGKVYTVEDRGGAIVPAGQRGYSYDRLDIWMGKGDEGRIAANNWGKRTVQGCIL